MRGPVLRVPVNEFDAGSRRQDVTVRGLAAMASMVEPINVNIRWKLFFDLTCVQVHSREYT
ncbi:hypothetical protein ES707_12103 [subsurface metagenome]